jgi:hypothetical protein
VKGSDASELSSGFLPAYTAKTAHRHLAQFQFLEDWPPHSPDLNSLDFSVSRVLQAKDQATLHSNLAALFLSIAAEWDWLAAVYISKTCCSFRHCHSAAKKNEV